MTEGIGHNSRHGDDFAIVEAQWGEHVDRFVVRMIEVSRQLGKTVLGEFNQYTFEAHPKSTAAEVRQPFDKEQWRSYFGGDR